MTVHGSFLSLSDRVTQADLQEMRELQVTLVIQLDQTDASLRRLRWSVLTLAILVLCHGEGARLNGYVYQTAAQPGDSSAVQHAPTWLPDRGASR